MSGNLPSVGTGPKREEKDDLGLPNKGMQKRMWRKEDQGLKQYGKDSESVLFRPMPTWVVRREQEAIARVPQRPGEEIAKNFRLNNPKKSRILKTHTFTTKALKYGKKGPPRLEESAMEANQAGVVGATNISRSPRSQTGLHKPMYQPTKVSYARNPASLPKAQHFWKI